MNTINRNDMSQEVNFREVKRALFGANGETMLDEAFQY
jgi:hypothetical protein